VSDIGDGTIAKIAIHVQAVEVLIKGIRRFKISRLGRVPRISQETVTQVHIDGNPDDGLVGRQRLHGIGGIHVSSREGCLAQQPGLLDVVFDRKIRVVWHTPFQGLVQLIHTGIHQRRGIAKPTIVVQIQKSGIDLFHIIGERLFVRTIQLR